jgi:vitamin B12 transporter
MNCSSTRAGIAALTPLALVSALSILIITPAAAQSASDKTLAPVVVTASRIEQPQTDALPHTTVITSDDIRNSPTFDLPSLLRREAGIQVTQNGGPGQSSSLFMRGAAPAQTLVLIDGVPVRRQGFSAQPALEHILPEQIDRIEIVRGNVSAIYGSGAIGGVVQIFTKQGTGQPVVSFSAEAGSRGTRSVSGGVSGKSGDTRYSLSAARFRTDGFSANNVAQFRTENPDKDGYRNNSVAGSVSNEWAKGHEIGARLYANDGKFDFDGGGFGGPTGTGGGTSKQQSFAVFSKNRFAPNWLSTVTLSQTETRNDNTYLTVFGTFREKGDTKLFQWANEVALSSNWTLVAGLDAGREELDAFSNNGFSGPKNNSFHRSTSSVYAGVNGKLDAHQFQANIRRDRVGGAGSDSTGYLGYGFALTPNVKLIASASTAFNAPTLTQFFDPMSGNPNLKAEKSRSYEVGAQYAAGATLLRATLFKTRTNNQFGIDPNNCFRGANPTSCPTFNIAKGSNEGLELSANTQVASVDLRASLTLQDPKDDTTNKRLIRRAKTMASLSMSKAFGAMRVGTDLQYTGSRPDVNFLTGAAVEHGSYWLANLSARYQVSKNVSLLGRVDNVFDRNYQTTYGYNQPPRGVFAGVNWQM